MLVAKSEMARLKQQEADFLKEEIRKLADEFAKERSQWTQIL